MRVKDLKVANYWGDDCPQTLPETLVVNLTEKTTWAMGTEVTLDTSQEDEALRVELADFPAVSEDSDNDMVSNTTGNDDEKGATGGIKAISTNVIEDKAESNKKVRVANDNTLNDTSDSLSSIDDDDNEVRRLRTQHISEWLTDERVIEIMVGV